MGNCPECLKLDQGEEEGKISLNEQKIDPAAIEDEGKNIKGEWVRGKSNFRNWITGDGSSSFPAEAGRYHLYIANNCPWSHRTRMVRGLLGLQDVISMDVLHYRRDADKGWQFNPEIEGCTPDTVNGQQYIREIYKLSDPETKEKSVPVLWDKKNKCIVNNESSEIIRMFNNAFKEFQKTDLDLYPRDHIEEIDEYNKWIYQLINNGAYKAGFAKSQEAYEDAYDRFFEALDRLEGILAEKRFLCGDSLTEADIRLFATLVRFDHVYYVRFKLNKKMLQDYENLGEYVRDVYQWPGMAEECVIDHFKKGYFGRNANNVVPGGPDIDLGAPHSRAQKFKS